jgi:DNA-binding HxlR family transcriptional regulator
MPAGSPVQQEAGQMGWQTTREVAVMKTVAARPASVCPVANAARLLGDRWTLVILRDLAERPLRFSEIEDASGGISPRTLADRLRQMEAQGLIRRESFREIPPRVQYSLTVKGEATLPVVEALRAFGETWLSPEEQNCC